MTVLRGPQQPAGCVHPPEPAAEAPRATQPLSWSAVTLGRVDLNRVIEIGDRASLWLIIGELDGRARRPEGCVTTLLAQVRSGLKPGQAFPVAWLPVPRAGA